MPQVRPIGHEERLSVVDHLDELRNRLIVCVAVLIVAFGFCFWQSGSLLKLLNDPLTHLSKQARNHISGEAEDLVGLRTHLLGAAGSAQLLARSSDLSATDRALIANLGNQLTQSAQSLPKTSPGITPITLGVGEPFTATLIVCLYFALLISTPVLLYEIFAFVIPALSPREKRIAVPIVVVAPALFFAGVVFTYLVVLPAAIKFLQGYNANHFQAVIQANQLYTFEALTMGAIGLTFEMPLILLGLHVAGLIDGGSLTRRWRYWVVGLAVVAAAMPGADPVTTGLETAPLAILYVVSIFMLKYADHRKARREAREALAGVEVGV